MVEEEKDHLGWVKHWLDAEGERRGSIAVKRVLDEYRRADEIAYGRIVRELEYESWQQLSGVS
jgi:rubrerythrin